MLLLLHYIYLKTLVTIYFADINYNIIKDTLTTLALFYAYRHLKIAYKLTTRRQVPRCELVDQLFSNILYFYFWYFKYGTF